MAPKRLGLLWDCETVTELVCVLMWCGGAVWLTSSFGWHYLSSVPAMCDKTNWSTRIGCLFAGLVRPQVVYKIVLLTYVCRHFSERNGSITKNCWWRVGMWMNWACCFRICLLRAGNCNRMKVGQVYHYHYHCSYALQLTRDRDWYGFIFQYGATPASYFSTTFSNKIQSFECEVKYLVKKKKNP